MNFNDSQTKLNLATAFSKESQATNRYYYYAQVAKKEGYEQISRIFLDTQENERAHAKIWYKELKGISDTKTNLMHAAKGEYEEWTSMYKEYARIAKEEGFLDIASKFEGVAAVEKEHEDRYLKLLSNLENNTVFEKDCEITWHCINCGHLHTSKQAPMVCPVCSHPQSYFEKWCNNY